MSNMDEVAFWVYTKQAPCLYNYDNLIKRQLVEAQRAARPASSPSDVQEVIVTPKKKTKRKLSLLGDESASPDKQNVYFETSQNTQRTVHSSYKSETNDSDSDFNIKRSSVQVKAKRLKLQKNSRTLHKKNKVVTSTPKPEITLRRSLRRQRLNDTVHSSFDVTGTHNKSTNNNSRHEPKKTPQRIKRERNHVEKNADGDHNTKTNNAINKTQKNGVIHRPFDDLSDVSGFTANYIRSTKVQITQSSRNLRSQTNKTNRDTGQTLDQGDRQTHNICVNKSVNTTKSKAEVLHHYSTDSSPNVINFVTTKPNDKNSRVNKSTSLLKFVDAQTPKKDINNSRDTNELNLSFRCRPRSKGHKMSTEVTETNSRPTESTEVRNRRLRGKNCNNLNDRKENPDDSLVSRTRSGRSIGLRQLENSVLVYNNSTEQISSGLTVNVACANNTRESRPRDRQKKRLSSFQRLSEQRSTDRSDLALRRNVTRERSGFTACFSDSDQEAETVKPRKFFC